MRSKVCVHNMIQNLNKSNAIIISLNLSQFLCWMYIIMVIRRKTSLSSTCSSPGVSPCPSPNVHRNRSVSANASARNTPSITPKSTPSHSPGTTPPMSPRSTSSSSESWKTRLHSIRNSFLGTPRFHRRKIPGKNIENEAAWLALWVCILKITMPPIII